MVMLIYAPSDCGRNGSSISYTATELSREGFRLEWRRRGGLLLHRVRGSSFLSAVHSRETAQLRVPSLSWHWRYYTESDSWPMSKSFKLESHFKTSFPFVHAQVRIKNANRLKSRLLKVSNNMKARTSQEDANRLVVWLLLLCWVMKFQNLFHFLLLRFAQPCEHSAVHSCNTATVVGACKNIRLLVRPMLGENAIQATRMSTHSFIYCFYYFEVPESCSVRESPWRRVCSPHQRVNVSPGKKADQPSPLDHQQRWRWRGLQPALSLWLLTSVWWGVIRARGSQQQLCTTGRECVPLHVGQFFTDGPIYYRHTPAVYHRSGLLFGR